MSPATDHTEPRWGLVATVRAPLPEIQAFAADHLERGAHRVYLYLDEPDPATAEALNAHSKLRVTRCDAGHWQKLGGKRPVKHQVRQARNATHLYRRRAEVDWLIHMDVDEFLWPETTVAKQLAALPDDILCARLRPVEGLGGNPSLFKAFIPSGPERTTTVATLYPTYGRYLRGGFLSHVGANCSCAPGWPTWNGASTTSFRMVK